MVLPLVQRRLSWTKEIERVHHVFQIFTISMYMHKQISIVKHPKKKKKSSMHIIFDSKITFCLFYILFMSLILPFILVLFQII